MCNPHPIATLTLQPFCESKETLLVLVQKQISHISPSRHPKGNKELTTPLSYVGQHYAALLLYWPCLVDFPWHCGYFLQLDISPHFTSFASCTVAQAIPKQSGLKVFNWNWNACSLYQNIKSRTQMTTMYHHVPNVLALVPNMDLGFQSPVA